MLRLFYLVPPGSRVEEAYNKLLTLRKDAVAAAIAYKDKIGATDLWTQGSTVVGATFDGDVPKGWSKGKQFCKPNRSTKLGKELYGELRSLPNLMRDPMRVSSFLSCELNDEYTQFGNHTAYFSVFMSYPEGLVLCVPSGLKAPPPGCVEEVLPSKVLAWEEATRARIEANKEREVA